MPTLPDVTVAICCGSVASKIDSRTPSAGEGLRGLLFKHQLYSAQGRELCAFFFAPLFSDKGAWAMYEGGLGTEYAMTYLRNWG